ncbi:phosphatidate cytidylyltransferase [Kocuria sp.]|jgi:phosphatidate cytidylyltransferase|uniref:phosphatidate cytidylyltransferase n=1 Tax=Kocuria sp. TaxID=1871328 RepID=UPI002812893E|nr:phosphatidate cytidylyltransferase [Kocuria sp.]
MSDPSRPHQETKASPGPAGEAFSPRADLSAVPAPAPRRGRRERRHTAPSRAGRNLPAAIGVAVVLIGTLLLGLFAQPVVLALLAGAAAGIGVWEVGRSLRFRDIAIPRVPAVTAGVLMPLAAFYGEGEALMIAVVVGLTLVIVWRALGRRDGMILSIMGSVFALLWVGFLLSIALLLYHTDAGPLKVLTVILLAVGSDTCGYAVGVIWGRHPMAPRISPKKSWEGFAGSLGGSVVIGVLCAVLLLDHAWWEGALLAVVLVLAATLGDFAESMVKRELGIKDMGTLLPGHGGVMDRIDSILFAVPAGYLLFELFAARA